MKISTNYFLTLILISLFTLGFTACSEEDDDQVQPSSTNNGTNNNGEGDNNDDGNNDDQNSYLSFNDLVLGAQNADTVTFINLETGDSFIIDSAAAYKDFIDLGFYYTGSRQEIFSHPNDLMMRFNITAIPSSSWGSQETLFKLTQLSDTLFNETNNAEDLLNLVKSELNSGIEDRIDRLGNKRGKVIAFQTDSVLRNGSYGLIKINDFEDYSESRKVSFDLKVVN